MGKQQKQCQTLSSWAPKSLQMVTAALKWKDTGQHIKNQRCYFANKNPCSQSYGFSSNHVWMWELDHEEGCALKNWCFWSMVLEKILESPLDSKEVKPVNPKGNQFWIFIGRTDAEALILQPPDEKNWPIGKDPDALKDWMQEKGITEDEMVGWLHWLMDVSLSDGRWWRTRKPGMLQSTGLQKVRHNWATEWMTTMAYYRIRIQIKISWGEKRIKVKFGKILTMELPLFSPYRLSSVQFSLLVMSDSLQPHEQQHARPPCPSSTLGAHPNSCQLSQWCHPTIPSSVVPFSSCPQSFPASGSFQMSQLAKVLEFQFQHQSFQWTPGTDLL